MFIKVRFPTVDCDTIWFIFFNIESPIEVHGACQAVHYECHTHKWKFKCLNHLVAFSTLRGMKEIFYNNYWH